MAKRQSPTKSRKQLDKKKPEKSLLRTVPKTGGRDKRGRQSVRHRGGGAKRRYRVVEFGQERLNDTATVIALEYDPNRTAFLALIEYGDGERKYILAPQRIEVGSEIMFAEKTEAVPGNRMRLKNVPTGTMVHNIELQPGRGGVMVRAAGSGAKVLGHDGKYTQLKMPSGEERIIYNEGFASVGTLSHSEHRYETQGKAGRNRGRGKRPHVRGSAMAAHDHPHGGGEGRAPIGLKYPKTPWGKPASGRQTRRRKHTDKYIVKRRNEK